MILLSKVGGSGIRAVAHRWRARMILQRRTGGLRVRMVPHLDAVLSSRARLVLLGRVAGPERRAGARCCYASFSWRARKTLLSRVAGPGGWLLQRPAHTCRTSCYGLTDANLLKARVNTAKQSSHVPNY